MAARKSPFAKPDYTTTNPQDTSPFFTKLPREIRDIIYSHVLSEDGNHVFYHISGSDSKQNVTSWSSLLWSCKATRREYQALLWRRSRDKYPFYTDVYDFDFSPVMELYESCEPEERAIIANQKVQVNLVVGEWGVRMNKHIEGLCEWFRFCERTGFKVRGLHYGFSQGFDSDPETGGRDDEAEGAVSERGGVGDDRDHGEGGSEEGEQDDDGARGGDGGGENAEQEADKSDDADSDGDDSIDSSTGYPRNYPTSSWWKERKSFGIDNTCLWWMKYLLENVPEELQETSTDWARLYRTVCWWARNWRQSEAETYEEFVRGGDWMACKHPHVGVHAACVECRSRGHEDLLEETKHDERERKLWTEGYENEHV